MPTITCQKQFTLSVLSPVSVAAYWTLNEAAGSADRVDSVASIHLVAAGVTDAGAPALFSNGLHFTEAFMGAGYVTLNPPQLAYAAPNGWSTWGWFKIVALGTGNFSGGPSYSANLGGNGAPGAIGIFVGDSVTPLAIYRGVDSATPATTVGAWHFFHLCYNGATNAFGYSLDNAAITYMPTPLILVNAATGGCGFGMNWTNGGGPGDMLFDEVGIVSTAMLTPAQQAYLYNGGAGRTWPIVLP